MQADFQSLLPSLLPASLPAPVARAAARFLGLEEAARTYHALQSMGAAQPLEERLLTHLEVTWRASKEDLERIPRTGPALVVANHPTGILDGAVLATILRGIRPDVRFLANEALAQIPELRELIIAVDPFTTKAAARCNHRAIRELLDHLQQGGMVVVFPAGEVAHFQLGQWQVSDPQWRTGLARTLTMAARRKCAPAIVPIHVSGGNSFGFQTAGLLHSGLRTALLARELWNKKRSRIEVRIGKPIEAARVLAIPTDEERMRYLRWRTYLLANRNEFKPNTRAPLPMRRPRQTAQAIPAGPSSDELATEVASLQPHRKLIESGDFSVYLAPAREMPLLLDEIGRLREVTFRAAGEGTGRGRDLDTFDAHYLHLFVWNSSRREIAGAYRLAGSDLAGRDTAGRGGLYTATLFNFDHRFLHTLGPALELGRSFVRQEYQKSFAPLLLLWKGIGKYVAANPRYKRLFGPVSISNQYQSISRELMISFLEKSASIPSWKHLVSARNAPPRSQSEAFCQNIDELSDLVSDIEPDRAGVPVLLRQYLRLGGKLLGFNIDPEFSNALDGLIVVDLTRTERKLLDRYLGREEAQQFLSAQEAANGTLESVHRH
ncbi:MAG: GNAT family N-acyltransferase [Acidobacteriota bacterium]